MNDKPASSPAKDRPAYENWKQVVARYQIASAGSAVWQLLNTLVPYAALWWLMYHVLAISAWLVVPLAILAGAFLVRVFVIFHDCGHGSFFKSETANHILGSLIGVLTFTPYFQWRWEHAIHHATGGDLDRRGIGDVWTLTLASSLKAISFRLWDEQRQRLVGYGQMRALRKMQRSAAQM